MNPSFPVVELVDRFVIAKIKQDKTGANSGELDFYQHEMSKFDLLSIGDHLKLLEQIHLAIWDKEKELKSGREHELSLEEIGRRAIQIRDLNHERIAIKNTIAEKLGCSVREIKRDHLSQ